MNLFDQTFGGEIECFLPDAGSQHAAAQAVTQRLQSGGFGQSCYVSGYTHGTPPTWKCLTDGSLGSIDRGWEFVSPILRGENGLAQIETVCKTLSDFGCTLSKKCGYHVHVGAKKDGLRPDLGFYKNAAKLYAVFETAIDSMMPPSRRASACNYARSMTSASPSALDRASNFDALCAAATSHASKPEQRFYKVNLRAWDRHRTVEWRHHSGTLDPLKARMWTLACLRMTLKAREPSLGLATSEVAINQARPGSKAHKIGEMLLRPEGVTGREIMTAMNWPSVSIPQQAKICGIEYTTQRTGREVRYFARTAGQIASPPPVPTTLEGFAGFIGAADDEKAYFLRRAQELSGPVQWAA